MALDGKSRAVDAADSRELLEENARLRRICAALIERVESSGVAGGAPYAAFEHAVLLAEQVRERTEALHRTLDELGKTNIRLGEAKADAEAANLSKTKFLAAVSHDLLQPLNAARLFASALDEHPLPEASAKLVAQISRSLKDVEALLGTLVDISRLDAGVLKPDIAPFRTDQLLDVLAEEYRQAALTQGLALHYVPSRMVIESDLALLARVIRNFLTNAIRYTRQGHILLGCRRRAEGLEIVVGDTGPGIAEAQHEAIFQEFRRVAVPTTGQDRGLGLGLAIVERIGAMLGHPLCLSSSPGRGSLFSILVPYGVLPAFEPAPAPRAPMEKDALQGTRIWVIDNDTAILEGMAALLEGWGCRVVTALSLSDLEKRTKHDPADVLLIDYHLGDDQPSGFAVAQRLQERHPGLATVLITANHEATIKRRARARGYGCLLKPLKPLRLRMTLTALLKASPRRKEQ
ncbi:hybrid sensor histidine kinase/response regulator [Pistricoccus aurantiacus]|uniref:hybrid sensor histidine kinase/response regulator n=1 Tax=Pistricoccus aurantiacus TaxID=1883414 RepID=UPI001FEA9C7C|nr:hybrid sensor histidine kinase/response regulator [Pistricoccus aurantiacus]